MSSLCTSSTSGAARKQDSRTPAAILWPEPTPAARTSTRRPMTTMLGQRRWQMHDQPPGRGQVRPTGYTRKPPCVVPADPLLFPADQRQTHGLSSGKGRIRHVPSVGSREASSIDNVLHLGLRVFLVGVDPLCTGGLSQSGRKLRALSCRARRTGAHGGQGWSAGPVSQNGSVACCARMVRGG